LKILTLFFTFIFSANVFPNEEIKAFQASYAKFSASNRLLSSATLLPELNEYIEQTTNRHGQVLALLLKSKIYLQYDAYSESMISLTQAENIAKELDMLTTAKVKVEQARLNIALERYRKALVYIKDAIPQLKDQDTDSYANALILKGRAYYQLGSLLRAKQVFLDIQNSVKEHSSYFNLSLIYTAQLALTQGNLKLAESSITSLTQNTLNNIPEEKQLALKVLQTRLIMQKGQFKLAIKQANELLKYTLDTRFLGLQAELQGLLAKSYLQSKDYRSAYTYMERHNLTHSALAIKKRNNKLLQLEAINNLANNKQRIRLLEKEAELTNAQLAKQVLLQEQQDREQQIQKRKWIFISVVFIIFSWLAYYTWHRIKLTKQLKKMVLERTDELEKKNIMLEKISNTDSLTGLHNRHYFQSIIDQELAHTQRKFYKDSNSHTFLAIMIVDIDNFKAVNDKYGHAIGDKVLQGVANLLKNTIRDSDYIVRWGGEEFLIILRDCNLPKMSKIAEQIRINCQDKAIQVKENKQLNITVSLGYAPYPFLDTQPKLYNWKNVMELADHALYMAKNNQRNAWLGYTPANLTITPKILINDISSAVKNQQISVQTNIKTPLMYK
jgi:diguanylate cyclase (GGDEF)-like protein